MSRKAPTFIGEVQSVTGAAVSVQLRDDLESSLMLISGVSYRVGQIGAFLRIPLGYNQLYGVCTQVGAAAAPPNLNADDEGSSRWLSIVLFGEAIGTAFERGVSQYPTVGDEVHLVTDKDLAIIYGASRTPASIRLGSVAAASGISAFVDLAALVSRHFSIVGSTGAGKSNLSAAILHAIANDTYPSARVLIIDPHGEYASATTGKARVFTIGTPGEPPPANRLFVPYWALPFDEFRRIAFGDLGGPNETVVRDEVAERKLKGSTHLTVTLTPSAITADSPIPFSAKQLWFDLISHEKQTYSDQGKTVPETPTKKGDPNSLIPNEYPPPAAGKNAPYAATPRGIPRQLEFFRSRLLDSRYSFLFSPGPFTPDVAGKTGADLGALLHDWIGKKEPITILDVSAIPSEIVGTIIGTVLTLVYDTLFWATGTPVSGRNQPLLVMIDEAHMIVPEGSETIAHRAIRRIAREGRKYGIGLGLVTQRPTEIDHASLSQCGTMMALRLSSKSDRNVVASALPDDLGNLAAMLPSLRTGEGIVVGEAMAIPSRVRFTKVASDSIGNDPQISERWRRPFEERKDDYHTAVNRWRQQSLTLTKKGPAK